EVSLYDVAGRRVRTIVAGDFDAGEREAAWDGRDDTGRPVANGVYFLAATSGGTSTRIKVGVVR
ncbi:MAG TPA: FlgD immunoglobulin-like domain containing protein, partial [Candidatus Eisenbacteria bacterium]